jgi:hypothetical protein
MLNFKTCDLSHETKIIPYKAKTKTKTNYKSKSSIIQISRERAEENQLIKGLKNK